MKMKGILERGMVVVAMVVAWGLATDAMAATMAVPQEKKAVTVSPGALGVNLCPDLAVGTIGYRLIERVSTFKWKVAIWGSVENKGNLDYVPAPNHKVSLKKDPHGSLDLAVSQNLPPIKKGAKWDFEFQQTWDATASSNNSGAVYFALSFGTPSINPASKDCNASNNESARLQAQNVSFSVKQKEGCPDLEVGQVGYRFISQTGSVKRIEFYTGITNRGTRDYVPLPLHTASLMSDPKVSPDQAPIKLPAIAKGASWHASFTRDIDVNLPANKGTAWYISLSLFSPGGSSGDPSHMDCNPGNNKSGRLAGSLLTN